MMLWFLPASVKVRLPGSPARVDPVLAAAKASVWTKGWPQQHRSRPLLQRPEEGGCEGAWRPLAVKPGRPRLGSWRNGVHWG